jgi:hypothetical protein
MCWGSSMPHIDNIPSDAQSATHRTIQNPITGLGTLFLFLLIIAGIGWIQSIPSPSPDAIHVQDRSFLQSLHVNDIVTIQIGRYCPLPKSNSSAFVNAIHTLGDFEVNHDLGMYLGVLTITLQSGEQRMFRLYQHQRGTVIEFYRGDDDNTYDQQGFTAYTVHGFVISSDLPAVLVGIDAHCV